MSFSTTCRINRYYDPTTDSFISVDPAVQSTNQPYVFVNGDPLNATDPLGLCGGFWGCLVSIVKTVGKILGGSQLILDAVTVVCLAGCEEVWVYTIPASAAAGLASTTITCTTAQGGSGCSDAAVTYLASSGQISSSATRIASAGADIIISGVESSTPPPTGFNKTPVVPNKRPSSVTGIPKKKVK